MAEAVAATHVVTRQEVIEAFAHCIHVSPSTIQPADTLEQHNIQQWMFPIYWERITEYLKVGRCYDEAHCPVTVADLIALLQGKVPV